MLPRILFIKKSCTYTKMTWAMPIRLSWNWNVLPPNDTCRRPVTCITAVLFPSVTYLLTLPRRKQQLSYFWALKNVSEEDAYEQQPPELKDIFRSLKRASLFCLFPHWKHRESPYPVLRERLSLLSSWYSCFLFWRPRVQIWGWLSWLFLWFSSVSSVRCRDIILV
jgi:hypothetical protein